VGHTYIPPARLSTKKAHRPPAGRERSGFHASGYIHGPGIEEMMETIKPEALIPVHTQEREFFKRFEGSCKVLWLEKGQTISIDNRAL